MFIAGGLLVFCLAYFSVNTEVGSDPKLTLVVSQAVLDTGAPFLDPYAGDDLLGRPFDSYVAGGDILEQNGHYVHYFPLGPSLISVPFVAVARGLGHDMRTTDNYGLQRLLSALTVVLVFLLAYALAHTYLDCWPALALAFVAVLGSSLISTLGTALWSHNYAVLFVGAALLLIAREANGKSSSLAPALLGLLLFLSFINRPSTVAFILPALAYLLWRQRRAFVIAAVTSAVLLAGYLAWNATLTGAWLPSYFSAARLQVTRAPLWVGIAGNLISPSRGLLIFSPFLLPVLAGYWVYRRSLLRQPLVWLCLVWFGLQLVIIARAASWWGGWSFGPRLLTDIWPGLIVLTAILWAFLHALGEARPRRAFDYTFLILGAVAITLHVVQGLYSQPASRWNGYITPVPPPGELGDLFNWRYAQPAATNAMLCDIERAAIAALPQADIPLGRYSLGGPLAAEDGLSRWEISSVLALDASRMAGASRHAAALPTGTPHLYLPLVAVPAWPAALYVGWSTPVPLAADQLVRWSQCPEAEIWLNPVASPVGGTVMLVLTGRTNDAQEVRIAVNGQPVGVMAWSGYPETQTIAFPASLLPRAGLTRLTFSFPSAHKPNLRDQRLLGLALDTLMLAKSGGEGLTLPAGPGVPPAYPP